MQGAVGPVDRLFEAPRGEMSDRNKNGGKKDTGIERAQTARPFDGFDRRLGWLRSAWLPPLAAQA